LHRPAACPADPDENNEGELCPGTVVVASCSGTPSRDAVGDGAGDISDRDASDGIEAADAGLGVGGALGGAVDTELPVKAELSCKTILGPPGNAVSKACCAPAR
jgi:hypothetical protein